MNRVCRAFAYRIGGLGLFALLIAAVATLGACSDAEPQPLRFGEAVWSPGESSLYRITDLNGRDAGIVLYEMHALEDDAWRLERLTQAQGDEEMLTVDMAVHGFRPRASELVRSDATGRERVAAVYDQGSVELELTTKQDVTTTETVHVPSDSRDARSLFMLVRSLPLAQGYTTRINTFLPVSSRMARTSVTVLGDEQVETPAGVFDTWVLELDEGDRQSRAWVAKEGAHPLVKYIDAANGGTFVLAEYVAGE